MKSIDLRDISGNLDLEVKPEVSEELDESEESQDYWISFEIRTQLKEIQKEAKDWLLLRERTTYNQVLHGGFFCDPPGMGKTLSLIAAVQANPGPRYMMSGGWSSLPSVTLVICPPQVINVWVNQLLEHTSLPLSSVLVYHGPNRKHLAITENTLFVITSYYILRNEFDDVMNDLAADHEPDELEDEPGFKDESVFNHNFYRIILDETHLAKNHNSKLSIALSYLRSCIKWVVTATPRINSLDDDFSYYRFLRLFPNWASWRSIVPNSKSNFTPEKLEQLAYCKQVMDRISTEICLIRDKNLLNLPPKTEQYLVLSFTPPEQKFYDSLQIYALSRVERLEQAIQDEALKECANAMGKNILGLIYRLKMATTNCMFVLESMPRLKGMRSLAEATNVLDYYNKSINRKEECAVCLDVDADHIANCGHKLCKGCWQKALKKQENCPFCRHHVTIASIKPVSKAKPVDMEAQNDQPKMVLNYGLQEKSTKLNKLTELLEKHIDGEKTKIVIVSQSIKTLNYVQSHIDLIYPGNSVRIDGSCPLESRNASIDTFQNDPATKIMYYSLTCNPEGITLTKATVLIHLDQWWNKTGKVSQVNDRIHRISQTKPTTIYYLSIGNTIETNIYKLQERKENIINYRFEGQEIKPNLLDHDFEDENIASESESESENEEE